MPSLSGRLNMVKRESDRPDTAHSRIASSVPPERVSDFLRSLEEELDRVEESYNSLQTRINIVMLYSATMTGIFFSIMLAVKQFAETSHSWQLILTYIPWAGVLSMVLAWKFGRGVRGELDQRLDEGSAVEQIREEFYHFPVLPSSRRLKEERDYLGIHRETWVAMLIGVGWLGKIAHEHGFFMWLRVLVGY